MSLLGEADGTDLEFLVARLGGTLVRAMGIDLELPQKMVVFYAAWAWEIVADDEGDDVARLWFVGANPWLDGDSPVSAIREGRFDEVLIAARALADGTWFG